MLPFHVLLALLVSPVDAPLAETSSWAELESAAESAGASPAGALLEDREQLLSFFGWLQIGAILTEGDLFESPAGEDSAGEVLRTARFAWTGQSDGVDYLLGMDGASGSLGLIDAWARFTCDAGAAATFGFVRAPFLFAAQTRFDRMLFPSRSSPSGPWAARGLGLIVSAPIGDKTQWWLAAHNGGDGDSRDFLTSGRVRCELVGREPGSEGGLGPDADPALIASLSIAHEGTLSDGLAVAGNVVAVRGPWYANLEVVDYDDDFVTGAVPAGIGSGLAALDVGGTTPAALAVAYAFDDAYQVAARYEVDDDADDTWRSLLGIVRFEGNARIGLTWTHQASDVDPLEGDRLELNLSLSF